jgi:glucose/arabinose dehydrogenase
VRITAKTLALSRTAVPVGEVRFAVLNAAAKPARFAIAAKRTRLLRKGQRATLVVSFTQPGTYRATARGLTRLIRVTQPEPEPEPEPEPARSVRLTQVGLFSTPTDIDAPPRDEHRLFIVEQPGTVRLLVDGVARPTPFLDLRGHVDNAFEGGLLSIAFAPDYATSGRCYVYYVDDAHELRLVEYRRDAADPDVADPASARLLLRQTKSGALNHNGGMLQFGPDGRLYLGIGDGGNTPKYAQLPDRVFGKIITVDPVRATWSIWATGLRNPWRFWIDAQTGVTYVADVGQSKVEEINMIPAGLSGVNFGWPCFEGTNVFDTTETCANPTPPVYQYGHGDGACSVTGGVVVRNRRLPVALQGTYLFGDFCGNWIRALRTEGGVAVSDVGVEAERPVSFGEDGLGRVYIGSATGAVYRLDPAD